MAWCRATAQKIFRERSIRRGLFVFGVGFGFNIFVWLPEDTFNWDVLTFIGVALLLLNGLRRLPLLIPILVAVISVAVGPLLRGMADYPAYWTNGYFECDLTLPDVLTGFLATGYFPLFPWVAYPVVGLVTGSLLFHVSPDSMAGDQTSDASSSRWMPIVVGAAFMATSGTLLAVRPYLPESISQKFLGGWTMFPATIEYVLATMGMALLLFGWLHQVVDRNPNSLRQNGMLNIAKTFSRYSFTIYVVHHFVHLWPMWIYAVAKGQETTFYWQKAMPVAVSLPLGFLFLAACYFAFRKIGPDRRLGIEGWMRWLCD